MTKNHGYELDILEVGIAYGSNVKEVKQILIDALMKLGLYLSGQWGEGVTEEFR